MMQSQELSRRQLFRIALIAKDTTVAAWAKNLGKSRMAVDSVLAGRLASQGISSAIDAEIQSVSINKRRGRR